MVRLALISLLTGFLINLCDVTVTVTTVADRWNAVLLSQGIAPSTATPPYYVTASFVAGALLVSLIRRFVRAGMTPWKAGLAASFFAWSLSRLYGGGHVVMGQMPAGIFVVMSSGLLLGFVVGGQAAARLLGGKSASSDE